MAASPVLPLPPAFGSVVPSPGTSSTQQPAGTQKETYLLHEIQHHLKTSLLRGLTVCGGLCLKLLTYLAHDTVLFLIFFKLLWRQRIPVTLQPFWILRKEGM